uniref:Uncharacterized protein n=1 Tax=Pseudomonas phage RVTF4 TaxID=3236931 RepID=A0AB39CCE1_9VIRU
MISNLFSLAIRGIAAAKVEPEMVLTAARDIFITIIDRDGTSHDILYANEGDQIKVESGDPRDSDSFICTNVDNHDEIGSVSCNDLEDTLKEYT